MAAGEVLIDGHLAPAGAAQDGLLVPFRLRPCLERMIGQGFVAVLAGVVDAAALHPDGHDVEPCVVVSAAGLRVEVDAADLR